MEVIQFPTHCSLCNVSHVSFSHWQLMCVWLVVLEPQLSKMTYCTEPLLFLPPPQLPAMHLFPQPALSLTHTHKCLRLWFQLGFFSLKTQRNLTGFDSEGIHIDPAIVTDIRQLDDNCCLMAETQVSLMADDNRQLWVMDGFDEKLQSWNKWKVCMLGQKQDRYCEPVGGHCETDSILTILSSNWFKCVDFH